MIGSRNVSTTWTDAVAKSSRGRGGRGKGACGPVVLGVFPRSRVRLCTPLDWRPRRVLRGRVEGPGRMLRVCVETLRLEGVDVTGKGGKVFSRCACLGAHMPWAGRDGLPLGVFFPWAV